MTNEWKREEARHYVLEGETGSFKLTPEGAELMHTAIRRSGEKNWLLLSFYVVITLLGIASSFCFNGWGSAAISFVVAVITFFVGGRMVRDMSTITITIK